MSRTSLILTVLAVLFYSPVILNRHKRGLSKEARALLMLCLVMAVVLMGAAIVVHLNE
jgi:hypothetical protein